MKAVLITKRDNQKALEIAKRIEWELQTLSVSLVEASQMSQADVVLVVGGDGTIMHAAKQAAAYQKPVLGINAGRLGFLAGLEPEELHLLKNLVNGNYEIEKRMLLELSYEKKGETFTHYALNEVAVTRNGPARMMDITLTDTAYGGSFSYRADGLILATPTGSTAYSLSAGGPVLDPSIQGVIVTPLCPFSLQARSLIFSPAHTLQVKAVCDGEGSIYACLDGEDPIDVTDTVLKVAKAENKQVQLIRMKQESFFHTYKNKIMDRNI